MIRLGPRTACLLALLLLLQWGTGFAHCLRPLEAAAGGHSVEVCGAEGVRTLLLDEQGRPLPPEDAHAVPCPGACGPMAVAAPAPPALGLPVAWPAAAPPRSRAGLPVAPPRAPPQQPRAPPFA